MQNRTREIVAVLLLGVLLLVGAGAMGYYIFIGHNWNVAASHIDDSIGKMDGYTVLLYAGTWQPVEEGEEQGNASGKRDDARDASHENGEPGEGDAARDDAQALGEPGGQTAEAGSGNQGAPAEQAPTAGEPEAPADSEPTAREQGAAASEVKTEGGESEEPAAKLADLLDEQAADLDSVVESYREKGANVFVLDAADISRYSEPFIVAKNGVRIGLFSVGKTTLRSRALADVRYLQERDADYTVGITNDTSLGKRAAEGYIGGASILLLDDPKGRFAHGEYQGSTYCVSAPLVGEVGVIIVSPSGVLSTKTIGGGRES